MPSYKVLEPGFFNGRLYHPEGKRKILHADKPFPSKDKKEQVPSWLEAIKAETAPTTSTGPTVKELKEKLKTLDVEFNSNSNKAVLIELLESAENAAKVKADQKEIKEASFLGAGENSTTVETL